MSGTEYGIIDVECSITASTQGDWQGMPIFLQLYAVVPAPKAICVYIACEGPRIRTARDTS